MTVHHLPTKTQVQQPWYQLVVHVCDPDGKPLCRFTDRPRGNWPDGHVWVSAARAREQVNEDVSHGTRRPGLCERCMGLVTADMVRVAVEQERARHLRGKA